MPLSDDITRIEAEIKITTDLFRVFNGGRPEDDPLTEAWERVKLAAISSDIKPIPARPEKMSPQEYKLSQLFCMAESPGWPVLVPLSEIFRVTGLPTKEAMRVVMSSLRSKIGPAAASHLTTRWGQGFVVAPGFSEAWQQFEREKTQ